MTLFLWVTPTQVDSVDQSRELLRYLQSHHGMNTGGEQRMHATIVANADEIKTTIPDARN